MLTELILTPDPIVIPASPAEALDRAGSGAIITFLGVVRGQENGEPISGLEYTAFEAMARHQFELLFHSAGERWPITAIRLIHRLGWVPAGEPSLWVEVASPHRGEAFAACRWVIDEMKRVVPIWKKVRTA